MMDQGGGRRGGIPTHEDIAAAIEGTLSDRDVERLVEHMRSHPEFANEVGDHLVIHAQLLASRQNLPAIISERIRSNPQPGASVGVGPSESGVVRTMQQVRAARSRNSSTRRRSLSRSRSLRSRWMALAAVLLFCGAGVALVLSAGLDAQAQTLAMVVESGGPQVGGKDVAAQVVTGRRELALGTTIRWTEDDRLRLISADGSVVRVGASGRLHIVATDPPRLHLDAGQLDLEVTKQASDSTVVISTDHLEGQVLGTRFSVHADERASRVLVDEGLVLVRERGGSGRWELGAGAAIEISRTNEPLRWRRDGSGRVVSAGGRWMLPDGRRLRGVDVWTDLDYAGHQRCVARMVSAGFTWVGIIVGDRTGGIDFDRLDRQVALYQQHGLTVLIRYQIEQYLTAESGWDDGVQMAGWSQLQRLATFWRQAASRYGSDPGICYQLGISVDDGDAHHSATAWLRAMVNEIRIAAPKTPLIAVTLRPGAMVGGIATQQALGFADLAYGCNVVDVAEFERARRLADDAVLVPASVPHDPAMIRHLEQMGQSWILWSHIEEHGLFTDQVFWKHFQDHIAPLMATGR